MFVESISRWFYCCWRCCLPCRGTDDDDEDGDSARCGSDDEPTNQYCMLTPPPPSPSTIRLRPTVSYFAPRSLAFASSLFSLLLRVSSRDVLLHPPTMTCNRRCCLVVCWQLCAKTSELICMKFSGKFGSGASNRSLNFGGYPGHGSGSGSVSRRW